MSDLSMKPSKEDLAHREQATKRTHTRTTTTSGGIGASKAIIAVLLIALVGGAGAGWYLWQQLTQQLHAVTQRLDNSNEAQADSNSALGSLQSALAVSERSLSKEKNVVSSDLVLLKSEVRKLWDVANKRNKKSIKSNKDNLAALSQASKRQKSRLAAQQKATSVVSLTVSQLQDELETRNQEKSKLISDVAALNEKMGNLLVENDMLKTLAVEHEKLLQLLKSGKFQRQITELEQAVDAIDAHRRQVNGRLDQMDKEMGVLYGKSKN